MNGSRFVPVAVVLSVLLALSAGLSAAQGPVGPQAMVGSAFTYQGQLLKDGTPINATCTMGFRLYDDPAAGNLVGVPITTTVAVAGGLFTVPLNSAGDFGLGAFSGEARWLEVAVLCPGDAAFSTLAPRQALTAAPYALSLRPGALIDGAVAGRSALVAVNRATSGNGLWGQSDASDGIGVRAWSSAASGLTYGVYGEADSGAGTGVQGTAPHYGVRGVATDPAAYTYGVIGQADSTHGFGVYGFATAGSGETYGVYGVAAAVTGEGVHGEASHYGVGGIATATSGPAYGVYGKSNSPNGIGVYGESATGASGTAPGVLGVSWGDAAPGVYGFASTLSGAAAGVSGESGSTAGRGVRGWASAITGSTCGVYGQADSSAGVGVYGLTTALGTIDTIGVYGEAYDAGTGVYGRSPSYGVQGWATGAGGRGVLGYAEATDGTGVGVYGVSLASLGYAGYFVGDVGVVGDLSVTGNKAFKIDHPLDPGNQYLYHYSVESSEVLNQYSGNVVLGADGSAWVELPAWFSAINQDIRYQLTPVGGAAPDLYIAQEVRDNRFRVAGGPPGLKVSWEITAVRNDPYLQRYGAPVEVEKPAEERGTYLHPELYGQPEELGRDYRFRPGRPAPAGAQAPAAEEMP